MLLKKNSVTHLSIQRVLSWCIMDSLRSLTNSKGILLCPSACIHFRLTILALWPVCLSVSSTGKQKKICHWRETHHQVHCTFSRKQLVVPIRKPVMCHSWNPIGAAWSRSISLLCCPRGRAAPLFHLWTHQAGGVYRSPCVFQTLCWPGLQAGPKLSPGEVWGVAPHLPANWGLLCLSAFLIQSANLPGNCIPLQQVTSGCVNGDSSERSRVKGMRLDLYCKTVVFICLDC